MTYLRQGGLGAIGAVTVTPLPVPPVTTAAELVALSESHLTGAGSTQLSLLYSPARNVEMQFEGMQGAPAPAGTSWQFVSVQIYTAKFAAAVVAGWVPFSMLGWVTFLYYYFLAYFIPGFSTLTPFGAAVNAGTEPFASWWKWKTEALDKVNYVNALVLSAPVTWAGQGGWEAYGTRYLSLINAVLPVSLPLPTPPAFPPAPAPVVTAVQQAVGTGQPYVDPLPNLVGDLNYDPSYAIRLDPVTGAATFITPFGVSIPAGLTYVVDPATGLPVTNTGGGGGPVTMPPIPDTGDPASIFSGTTLAILGIAATVLLSQPRRGR